MRNAFDWMSLGRSLALFTAIGAFLAFIDPYDATGDMGWGLGLFYWTLLIFVGGFTGRLGVWAAGKLQSPPHWAALIGLGSATAALGVTVAICLFYGLRFGISYLPLGAIPRLYGLVFVISVAVTSIAFLFDRAQAGAPSGAESGQPTDPKAKFLERLPVKFRTAELYAISSEDHYLRVHTSLGEELILMRLADAVRELDGADGLQTHRSWWVARNGVSEAKRDNGKLALVLKSGTEAPVSRTYSKAVREAGLSA